MIQSFDWIPKVRKNTELKRTIICYMEAGNHSIIIDRFQITFSGDTAKATVRNSSSNVSMACKIVPVEIPYAVLQNMLEGNYDDCQGIRYLNK